MLRDVLRELKERGKTILLTTHYMPEADELCDRIAIINKGKIVASGTSGELKSGDESLEDAYVRLIGAEEQDQVGKCDSDG